MRNLLILLIGLSLLAFTLNILTGSVAFLAAATTFFDAGMFIQSTVLIRLRHAVAKVFGVLEFSYALYLAAKILIGLVGLSMATAILTPIVTIILGLAGLYFIYTGIKELRKKQ